MNIVNTLLGEFPKSCVECIHRYVCGRREALERVNRMYEYAGIVGKQEEVEDLTACHYFANQDDFALREEQRE